MKRICAFALFVIMVGGCASNDPFSPSYKGEDPINIQKWRTDYYRVLTLEQVETLPVDITVSEVTEIFGVAGTVAPEIPFFFVYPRECQPRESNEDKYRYGFYFWTDRNDQIAYITYIEVDPEGEWLSPKWLSSHKIVWPHTNEGQTLREVPFFEGMEASEVEPGGGINSVRSAHSVDTP